MTRTRGPGLASANLLSAYRTGGIPGVGAKYLARKDSRPWPLSVPASWERLPAAFAVTCPHLHHLKIKGHTM